MARRPEGQLERRVRRLLQPIERRVRELTLEELACLKAAEVVTSTDQLLAARTAIIVDREMRRRGL
jgi:hypothetical protein